jgi:hypothetical protein
MSHPTPAIDIDKAHRETRRWLILQTLNIARPVGATDTLMISAISQTLPTTMRELRLDLDYLAERELIKLTGRDQLAWQASLTRHGIDLAEYTIPCEPGIDRPKKYF